MDLQLLGDLLKREVLEIARYLHIPSVIINKPHREAYGSGRLMKRKWV